MLVRCLDRFADVFGPSLVRATYGLDRRPAQLAKPEHSDCMLDGGSDKGIGRPPQAGVLQQQRSSHAGDAGKKPPAPDREVGVRRGALAAGKRYTTCGNALICR